MRRYRVAVVFFLFAAPFGFLLGMGWYALWERGWAFWTWWAVAGTLAAAYGLALYWFRRHQLIPPLDFKAPVLSTDQDRQAWQLVEARAEAAGKDPPPDPTDLQHYLDTAREMSRELAHYYHPRSSDPVGSLTIPEILAVIELAAHDLAEMVERYVPAGHVLTIDHLRKARKAADWYQKGSNVYWLAAAAAAPLETGARYFASRLGITRPWQQIQQNLLVWFYTAFVQRLGHYLIEVYSGRLRVGASRYRELVHGTAGQDGTQKLAQQVTVTLVGQTKVGKSSLINALLGEQRAKTDVIPCTEAVTRYELNLEDVPTRLVLLDTAGYGHEGPKQGGLAVTLDAARRSDLLVLVLHARNPARQADLQLLEGVTQWFKAHPDLKAPPVLGVLTHIDLLSPVMEWAPPYTWEEPRRPKEQQIAEAVAAVKEQLGPYLCYIAPVCTAEGKIYGVEEWCLPALVSVLDEAQGVALVRTLKTEARAGQIGKVFSQLLEAGKHAVNLLWEKPLK